MEFSRGKLLNKHVKIFCGSFHYWDHGGIHCCVVGSNSKSKSWYYAFEWCLFLGPLSFISQISEAKIVIYFPVVLMSWNRPEVNGVCQPWTETFETVSQNCFLLQNCCYSNKSDWHKHLIVSSKSSLSVKHWETQYFKNENEQHFSFLMYVHSITGEIWAS